MQHRKKSKAGRDERIEVLTRYLPNIAALAARGPSGADIDDLLDAAVAALSSRRWLRGEAARVSEPQHDARGATS